MYRFTSTKRNMCSEKSKNTKFLKKKLKRNSCQNVFYKKAVLEKFYNILTETREMDSFRGKASGKHPITLVKRVFTLEFSSQFLETFLNSYSEKNLWMTASKQDQVCANLMGGCIVSEDIGTLRDWEFFWDDSFWFMYYLS